MGIKDSGIDEKLILKNFDDALGSSKELSGFYFGWEDGGLSIIVLVKGYKDSLENKIYNAEWKISKEHPKAEINVRVVPKFNFPNYKLIPKGFQKYSLS